MPNVNFSFDFIGIRIYISIIRYNKIVKMEIHVTQLFPETTHPIILIFLPIKEYTVEQVYIYF